MSNPHHVSFEFDFEGFLDINQNIYNPEYFSYTTKASLMFLKS